MTNWTKDLNRGHLLGFIGLAVLVALVYTGNQNRSIVEPSKQVVTQIEQPPLPTPALKHEEEIPLVIQVSLTETFEDENLWWAETNPKPLQVFAAAEKIAAFNATFGEAGKYRQLQGVKFTDFALPPPPTKVAEVVPARRRTGAQKVKVQAQKQEPTFLGMSGEQIFRTVFISGASFGAAVAAGPAGVYVGPAVCTLLSSGFRNMDSMKENKGQLAPEVASDNFISGALNCLPPPYSIAGGIYDAKGDPNQIGNAIVRGVAGMAKGQNALYVQLATDQALKHKDRYLEAQQKQKEAGKRHVAATPPKPVKKNQSRIEPQKTQPVSAPSS